MKNNMAISNQALSPREGSTTIQNEVGFFKVEMPRITNLQIKDIRR